MKRNFFVGFIIGLVLMASCGVCRRNSQVQITLSDSVHLNFSDTVQFIKTVDFPSLKIDTVFEYPEYSLDTTSVFFSDSTNTVETTVTFFNKNIKVSSVKKKQTYVIDTTTYIQIDTTVYFKKDTTISVKNNIVFKEKKSLFEKKPKAYTLCSNGTNSINNCNTYKKI